MSSDSGSALPGLSVATGASGDSGELVKSGVVCSGKAAKEAGRDGTAGIGGGGGGRESESLKGMSSSRRS